MPVTIVQLITGARNIVNDRYDDHFSKDDITAQVYGVNLIYQLNNRNIVEIAEGSPANIVIYDNDVPVTPASKDKVKGTVTFITPIALGHTLRAEYFYVLANDAVYTEFAGDSANFIGAVDPLTIPDLMVDACHHYIASKVFGRLSSLSAWFYSANAGNKSFNKDSISAKFKQLADDNLAEAEKRRDDVYKRHGKRFAPSTQLANMRGVSSYTPRR